MDSVPCRQLTVVARTRKKATRKTTVKKKTARAKTAKKATRKKTVKKKVVKKKVVRAKTAKKATRKKAVKKKVMKKKAPRGKVAAKAPSRKPVARESQAARERAVREQLSKAKIGTFQDLFGTYSPDVQAIAHRLREMIFEILPEAKETVYLGWRIALYKEITEICGIQPASDRCNFYLTKGAFLRDPHGLLEGTGKSIRHVKVRSVVGLPIDDLQELIRQARGIV